MMIPDLINGAFELSGSLFISLSILKLYRDKRVRGVHYLCVGFFMFWGLWNLYYYPHLDQWLSFIGGLFVVATNALWLGQIIYYLSKERREARENEEEEMSRPPW